MIAMLGDEAWKERDALKRDEVVEMLLLMKLFRRVGDGKKRRGRRIILWRGIILIWAWC